VRYPAALPTLALAAGIAAGVFLPAGRIPPSLFLAELILCWFGAALALFARRDRMFLGQLLAGFAMCGLVLGNQASGAALGTPLGEWFDRTLPPHEYQLFATIEGTLRADATRGPNGVTLSIDVDRIVFDRAHIPTSGGVIIGVGGDLASGRIAKWRAGRRVRAPVTLRRPAKYLDPGVSDSQRDYGWKGTSLVGSVKSDGLVDFLELGTPLSEALASCRSIVRAAVDTSVTPWSERSAAVVTAILIGDRAGLDDEMQRQLQEAGTYHVIAISGGNIAILAGLCVMLLRLFRCGPRSSAVVIIVILIVYALVVGGGSSVGRATLMAVIYFAAQLDDHRSTPGNVAAVSAAALFCVSPLEVVDASFALTFGATLGLLAGMPRLKRPARMPGWIYAVVALLGASICAEVALLPVSAFVFSRVTAAGLLLNFAAIPLMTLVQIAGMLLVALVHVSSRAALWTGYVAHLGVRGILVSASLVETWPLMTKLAKRVPPPSLWLMGTYYGALVLALLARPRWARTTAVVTTVLCGWWMVAAPAWRSPWSVAPAPLRVTFLDVGQGDAAIVQFPNGRTLSIDNGGIAGTSFDIGSRVVSPAYWALGIRRLDYMSISHGDPDHIGGAASVFRDFRPAEIWEGVPVPPHEPTKRLRALADAAAVPWRTLQPGDHLSVGEVLLTVHHPSPPDWERQRVRNDDSEVIEIRYGGVSFVFTGDIGRETETAIAASFTRAPVRILKVPHHGSATSSSIDFLHALHPDIAVISDGRGNPYGHPVPLVLERYRAMGAAIYRTDLDGAVTVETDGRTVRVHTFTNRRLTLRTHDHH
jgi:competence protein ComEC